MIELNSWESLHADSIEEANVCVMAIPFDGAVTAEVVVMAAVYVHYSDGIRSFNGNPEF